METQAFLRESHSTHPETSPEPATHPEPTITREAANELRARNAQLAALYVAGARLCANLDWDPLVKQIIDTSTRLMTGDGASLLLLDEPRRELYFVASSHLPQPITERMRVEFGAGVVGWVAQNRESVLLSGPLVSEQYPGCVPKSAEINSAICVPIIPPSANGKAEQVLGVLTVHRHTPHPDFSPDDVEVLTALSTQVAVALKNAKLHQRMQRQHTQLQHLVEIGRHLTAILETQTVLRLITTKAIQLLQCEAGSLLLVDEDTQELVFQVALGPAGSKLTQSRLALGRGIAGSVALSGKPLIVNDAKADPRHDYSFDAMTRQVTRSLLCVPLTTDDRVIGVLEVMNKTDGTPFDEEDCEALAGFAVHSTIALENARLYSDLRRALTDTVSVIANAVEARDPYTAGHSGRVTHLSMEIAKELGWTREQLEMLEIGALLHDIGKIGVQDSVLRKPSHLTDDEYFEMKQHPVLGARVIESVGVLRPVLPYILYHQEHYDGRGYPFGLSGKEIPIEGRLLAVVDSYDAMTSDRPYHTAMSPEVALGEIVRYRGTQFDPEIVDVLVRVLRKEGIDPAFDPTVPSNP